VTVVAVARAAVMEPAAVVTPSSATSRPAGAPFAVGSGAFRGGCINERVDKFEQIRIRRSVSVKGVGHFDFRSRNNCRLSWRENDVPFSLCVKVCFLRIKTGVGRGFIYLFSAAIGEWFSCFQAGMTFLQFAGEAASRFH